MKIWVLRVVFVLSFIILGLRGTLIPNGTISLDCSSQQTFTCSVTSAAATWTISGLNGISATSASGQVAANSSTRITTTDTSVTSSSTIIINGFTRADDAGTIGCFDIINNNFQGMVTVRVESLPPPSNATATTPDHNCTVITLQWDKPDAPSDITSAVSCSPSSTACGACTSSPCNITDLALNTDFNFTVTLNSGMCGTSMTTTTARTMGVPQLLNVDTQLKTCTSVDVTWKQQPATTPTTSVAVTYCPTSSPNCGTSTTCTIKPCTIYELTPNTTYDIIAIPNNNCGMGTAIAAIVTTPPDSPYTETPTSRLGLSGFSHSVPVGISVAVTFTVTSVVSSSMTAVIMYFVCIRKKRSGVVKDTVTGGDIYEDPDRSGDIKMDPSPAYQTVSSVCAQ